ncbi:MAG: hypothetical protein HDR03_08605 [Lachnospiraceae bacterium]|nr:hypothetical protein [Lachnospiraceae bacterium]
MGRDRRVDREFKNTMDVIKDNSKIIAENSQTIVENTGRTNEKLDDMRSDIDAIKGSGQMIAENTGHIDEKLDDVKSDVAKIRESTTSKLPIIVAIIGVIVAVVGVIASISDISIVDIISGKKTADVTSESVSETEPEPEYTIYLYPEYSKFNIGVKIDMTASLNFETDAVSITAHLASGKEDTVELSRKNETEWQKKVVFDEVGVHEIVVAATAPNGEVIENSIEVEVTPISIDMDIDMDAINQLFGP